MNAHPVTRCMLCPNEADLEWGPPAFQGLTPAGVVLVEKLKAGIGAYGIITMRMCAPCFDKHSDHLGERAVTELARRKTMS